MQHWGYLIYGAKRLLWGVVTGLPIGLLLLSFLQRTGLASLSVPAIILVQIALIAIILTAVAIPVSRALQEQPVTALRGE